MVAKAAGLLCAEMAQGKCQGGSAPSRSFFIVQRKQAALSGLPAQGADKKGKQEGEALGKGEGKPYARKAPHP